VIGQIEKTIDIASEEANVVHVSFNDFCNSMVRYMQKCNNTMKRLFELQKGHDWVFFQNYWKVNNEGMNTIVKHLRNCTEFAERKSADRFNSSSSS